MQALSAMYETGLVIVFYHPEIEVVKNVAYACAEGGARLLEFTHRGTFAQEVFADLEKYVSRGIPQLILGVGSITEPYTAAHYINNGANFVVSPLLNPEISKVCNRRKVAYSPGCGTLSEISQAEELGAEIVKIFPGREVGGPGFVRSIKGPCPWTSIMPTGGVEPTLDSLRAWFSAGVSCVGLGSQLITKEALDAKDYKDITKRVRETLEIITKVRSEISE
jgi:2-dehydro-3-deoxyphosphogluconate aldolase/(4S)-4-hydroxy-2-oxoglutarate aldolase